MGPGINPHITMPPSNKAVVGEPGIPRVNIGNNEPVEAALFAVSGATTPSMLPFPNVSGFFEVCLAKPYAIKEAGVAPAAGSIPTKKPKNEPRDIVFV